MRKHSCVCASDLARRFRDRAEAILPSRRREDSDSVFLRSGWHNNRTHSALWRVRPGPVVPGSPGPTLVGHRIQEHLQRLLRYTNSGGTACREQSIYQWVGKSSPIWAGSFLA